MPLRVLALLSLLPGSACALGGARAEAVEGRVTAGLVATDVVADPHEARLLDAAATKPGEPQSAPDARKMIYRASLGLEVARVDEAIERFLAAASELGGHLSSRSDATVTVRVPAARFQDLLARARSQGRVLRQELQADDVTKEWLDLEIRLDNARKSRERLLALMEKATKVEELLAIEEQLRRLTTELEQMEGTQRYLADQVALATLAVEFRPVAAATERRRVASRFDWVNRVGVERMRRDF